MMNRKLAIEAVLLLAPMAAGLARAQNQTPPNEPPPPSALGADNSKSGAAQDESLLSHMPVLLRFATSMDWGHLKITRDDIAYTGAKASFQFDKSDVLKITLWEGSIEGLDFHLKGGKTRIFFASTEDTVARHVNVGNAEFLAPSVIGDAIIAQWGWRLGPNNKSIVP